MPKVVPKVLFVHTLPVVVVPFCASLTTLFRAVFPSKTLKLDIWAAKMPKLQVRGVRRDHVSIGVVEADSEGVVFIRGVARHDVFVSVKNGNAVFVPGRGISVERVSRSLDDGQRSRLARH